jgi:hypothetical protein
MCPSWPIQLSTLQPSSLGEVEKGFAQAFPAVRWILLVSLAITLKGTVDGVAEGAKEG